MLNKKKSETIQIGEIIEVILPQKKKSQNIQNEEVRFIDTEVISYVSSIKKEDEIHLEKFLILMAPILFIGMFLFLPLPAFAAEKMKQKVKSPSANDFNYLDEIGKANGFKVIYPSYIREKIALEAKIAKAAGKKISGRRLVEKIIKKTPLFNPKFQAKEILLPVLEPVIDKILVTNSTNNIANKIENNYLFLFPAAIGILQSLNQETNIFSLPTIRGGALPVVLGWLGSAWGLKKNVEQVIDVVRGKKQEKNELKWNDFFSSENSNKDEKNAKTTNFISLVKQAGTSGGSIFLVWYFLAIYNKSRREGKKLPVPEFILPDLVPEVRRVTFREKLYNLVKNLVDLSTPTPYAIIILATFIYFFVYAGKGPNPIDNAFSFVNTLFQQLVKATESTQAYLTEEIRRTTEEAKNAQKELKEEHRLQREKLTKSLNSCENEMSESLVTNNYLTQINQNLNGHLQMCEQQYSIEYEKNRITSKKIGEFGSFIKNQDGSFNQQKFDALAAEIQDVIHNEITNGKTLEKIQQRSEDRLYNIERSHPPFPKKKVVEYDTPANQLIDGILNLFGIQTKPAENKYVARRSSQENFSNKQEHVNGEDIEGK